MVKTFNIVDFGAVPNNKELQTEAIQTAIDACFLVGGGVVIIPEGVFNTGGIRLRSNITLHLLENAVLKGSRNPEDYFGYLNDNVEPLEKDLITDKIWTRAEKLGNGVKNEDYEFMSVVGGRWSNGLVRAINAENITIIGESGAFFDGSDCFDEKGEENYRGPHCISFNNCKNIRFLGYTVKNSANWGHCLTKCHNVNIDNVTVLAGHDGVHLNNCQNIIIDNCHFFTGDDCVAGIGNLNLIVKNSELNSACSAIRFGGTNALFEKCHMYGPCKYFFRGSLTDEEKRSGTPSSVQQHRYNMLSAFTYYSDFSFEIEHQPGNIVVKDCNIDYADKLLHFNFSGGEWWQQNKAMDSFRFENIKATDVCMPLIAYGDKNIPINFEMINAEVSIRPGYENIDFMQICNYRTIKLENIKIKNFKGDNLIKKWSYGNIELSNVDCDKSKGCIVDATEKFEVKPI